MGVYETLVDRDNLRSCGSVPESMCMHYLIVMTTTRGGECGRSYLCRILDMVHMGSLMRCCFWSEVVSAYQRLSRNASPSEEASLTHDKQGAGNPIPTPQTDGWLSLTARNAPTRSFGGSRRSAGCIPIGPALDGRTAPGVMPDCRARRSAASLDGAASLGQMPRRKAPCFRRKLSLYSWQRVAPDRRPKSALPQIRNDDGCSPVPTIKSEAANVTAMTSRAPRTASTRSKARITSGPSARLIGSVSAAVIPGPEFLPPHVLQII